MTFNVDVERVYPFINMSDGIKHIMYYQMISVIHRVLDECVMGYLMYAELNNKINQQPDIHVS